MTEFSGSTDEGEGSSGSSGAPWTTPGPLFYIAEIQYRNFDGTTGTLYVSDLGYKTGPADSVKKAIVVYPPLIASAFNIDRKMNLPPDQPSAAASWGSISLANNANQFNALAVAGTCDGQRVHIYAGRKGYDPARGYFVDPDFSGLTLLFAGFTTDWFCSDTTLDIPLRDATYLLERNIQTATYGGTGALDGDAALVGLLKPMTRGAANYLAPVLVDATNRIYQWTDAPTDGANYQLNVYEGGVAVFTNAGDVADLYTGTTPSGQYRTCMAKGLFQLGTAPVHQITVCGYAAPHYRMSYSQTGNYYSCGCHIIALSMILDDFGISSDLVDATSFQNFAPAYNYEGGYYTGTDAIDGATIVGEMLSGIGATLITRRTGTLALFALRALAGTETPVASFSRANAVSLTPVALDATLTPPPYQYQVEYGHIETVQTTDLGGAITAAQTQVLSVAVNYATWNSTANLANYAKPNDPPIVPGRLLYGGDPSSGAIQAGAQPIVNALGALWGARRRLYNLVIPVDTNLGIDIGSVVRLTWPLDNLAAGQLGQIVGEQFRGGDDTLTLQVLV